jgi:hypothetical protein
MQSEEKNWRKIINSISRNSLWIMPGNNTAFLGATDHAYKQSNLHTGAGRPPSRTADTTTVLITSS